MTILQITIPHKRDRCVEMMKAIVEPLSLCPTLSQDENGLFPIVAAKDFLGKQLADFSSARLDRSDVRGDPITLLMQVLYVHAWASRLHSRQLDVLPS
jgi:hypothetical protein